MTDVIIYPDTETEQLSKGTELGIQTDHDTREPVTDAEFLRFTASEYVMDGKRTEKSLRELFDTYVEVRGIEEDFTEFQDNFDLLTHLYDTMKEYVQTSQSEDQEPPSIFQAFIYLQEFGVGDLADKFATNVLRYHLYDNKDKGGISRYTDMPAETYTEEDAYNDFLRRRETADEEAKERLRALAKAAEIVALAKWNATTRANTARILH